MNKCILRDEKGIMKAKFDKNTAYDIIKTIKGDWKKSKIANKDFYQFTETKKMYIGSLEFFLWEGDKIYMEKSHE